MFSLPWREGVRGRGIGKGPYLTLSTLTLSLSHQGRGKRGWSSPLQQVEREFPSRERKLLSGDCLAILFVILGPIGVCHSEPCGRRISVRLFAEFILGEIRNLS
jgi:hypothetical protein